MKLCITHFDELKLECKKHNLLQFMAPDGAEILRRVGDLHDTGGQVTKDNFEPVMAADMAIKGQYIATMGPTPISGCPLCLMDEEGAGIAQNWIQGAVSDQVEMALFLGVLP